MLPEPAGSLNTPATASVHLYLNGELTLRPKDDHFNYMLTVSPDIISAETSALPSASVILSDFRGLGSTRRLRYLQRTRSPESTDALLAATAYEGPAESRPPRPPQPSHNTALYYQSENLQYIVNCKYKASINSIQVKLKMKTEELLFQSKFHFHIEFIRNFHFNFNWSCHRIPHLPCRRAADSRRIAT